MVQNISKFGQFLWGLIAWKGFTLPVGERIKCWKDRSKVSDVLVISGKKISWGTNVQLSRLQDPGRLPSNGVGSGTPMQLGRTETRVVTWGSGYGRYKQWKSNLPLPLVGSRYWITGYPVPQYDKRCIVAGPDGIVHELIQFDQDLGVLPAGLPQQALNRGSWQNGVLIDGVATTAAGLPSHGYVWGAGSAEDPHVQAFTIQDYKGGDGSDEFQALEDPDLPRCGDWYYLEKDSDSYRRMIDKGGECAVRAKALNEHGARLIDRGNSTSFLTQAGTWANSTNTREFQINLNDLRRVY